MTRWRQIDSWEPSIRHRKVRDEVARAFGIEPHVAVGHGRRREIVWPRHIAVWVVRTVFPQLSYPMIGKLFGGRDHSSIIYGFDKVKHRREREADFAALTDALVEGMREERPAFDLTEDMRQTVKGLCERAPTAIAAAAKKGPKFDPRRQIMPRNDFAEDDADGAMRAKGSRKLAAAIKREGLVCR